MSAQLNGQDLTLDEARPLRNDISTDEITPLPVLVHFDETLGQFAHTGLKAGKSHPIGKAALLEGGFSVVVGRRGYGKGASRDHSPVAEYSAGVRLVMAESFERLDR